MNDLPELPAELAAAFEDLDPAAVAEGPAFDADNLTPGKLFLIRDWLHMLMHDDESFLSVVPLSEDQLDRAVSATASDFRRMGINLRDRRDLLITYFGLQCDLIMIQRDWSECHDPHTYIHFARPLANLALTYELLLLEVFGEDAPYYAYEGGE